MVILLSTVGSLGDLHPVLGLGQTLAAGGAKVFLVTHPFYRERVLTAGLEFIGAGPEVHLFEEIKKNPQFLDPQSAPLAVWNEFVVPGVEDFYQATYQAIQEYHPVLLAGHFLAVGSLLAAYQTRLPVAVLMTTPTGWLSSEDLVLKGGYLPCFTRPIFRFLRERIFSYCSQSLKPVCEKLQIAWNNQIAEKAMRDVNLNLGLWSPFFRPASTDDPPRSFICGFCQPFIDPSPLPPEIDQFLREGEPPVIVTFGSAASLHARDLYSLVSQVSLSLNLRCLLIGPGLRELSVPGKVATADYLPYQVVFPRAKVIVHHGGINTIGDALQSGKPQMILPFCHDQFDNAARCLRLGVGLRLDRYRLTEKTLSRTLSKVLQDAHLHSTSEKIQQIIIQEARGNQVAATHLLSLVNRRSF
ncbi:MAG: glycosyltransferase [Candidatus Omnitrophica bacterium]|nr:glycosyltransferase [Candidatus Omnitrophota bacterium]